MNINSNIKYIIGILLLILLPFLINNEYLLHLLIMGGIYTLLVSGLNLIVGYIGQLSLCHPAFFGIGAYTTGLLFKRLSTPFLLNFLLAGIITAIISIGFGYITLRVRGSAFIIMTVSFLHIMHLLVLNEVDFTMGQKGISGIPNINILGYNFNTKTSYYYLILILCLFTLFIIYRLVNSEIGRAWKAIRDNENLAKSIGINVFKFSNFAFVSGAFIAGLAGSIYAYYINYISPDLFLFSITTTLLVMLIMGGKGTILGPVIGAIIFTLLPEYLRFISEWRMPVFGVILILGILFFPRGLFSIKEILSMKMKKKEVSS